MEQGYYDSADCAREQDRAWGGEWTKAEQAEAYRDAADSLMLDEGASNVLRDRIICDTALADIIDQCMRMQGPGTLHRTPLDEAETGRRFLALVATHAHAYCEAQSQGGLL